MSNAVYKPAFPTTIPEPTSPTYKIIHQDSKQVATEAREAIHIRINNPALTITEEKCTSQKSSTTFLEQSDFLMGLTKW